MKIECVWEHNGEDTLLYAGSLPGAYTRGESLETALRKMDREAISYLRWTGVPDPERVAVEIVQERVSSLEIRDADSDVLFESKKAPLCFEEYAQLKALALKSAEDFLALYEAVPDKTRSCLPVRQTFYGQVPRTAEEMYIHTKSVNSYYFGEIGVEADNEGTIAACRRRVFAALEAMPDFLANYVVCGSYDEDWTLRKVLRRFIWHDRIHARAMYRMACNTFGNNMVPNIFLF